LRLHRNSLVAVFALLAGCSRPAQQSGVFIDPALIALVPADTTVLAGARVDAIAKTPAFQKLATNAVIQDVAKRTNIDPAKALWQIMFTSNGRRGLVLARGKFTDELMAPDLTREGIDRSGYKGLTMFGNAQDTLVFFNSSTVAIGDTRAVHALIDERSSIKGLPARFDALIQAIPKEAHLWGAFLGGPVELPLTGNLANLEKLLGMVQSGTFYATFDDKMHVTASLAASSDQSAQDLHGAVQVLMTLANLQGQVTRDGARLKIMLDANF